MGVRRVGLKESKRAFERAKNAQIAMNSSKTRDPSLDPVIVQTQAINNAHENCEHWRDFLTNYNRIYNKLSAACKRGASKGWLDIKKPANKRSAAQLLDARQKRA